MLVISKLSFKFRHRRLFHDLSLTSGPGDLWHISGPNGVGKSTFLSVVAGLLSPSSGDITLTWDQKLVEDRRSHLEYLPAEANGLYLKMDAVQNLKFWSELRGLGLDDAAIFGALEPWGLNHPLLRDGFPIEKYSTGMKRRLALARLDLSPTPGWLLDEPLYGLDQQALTVFRERLRHHLSRGGFALLVSHDLEPFRDLITGSLDIAKKGGV